MERGRAPRTGRTYGSCWSSRGWACSGSSWWPPNPGGCGVWASWPMSFPALCIPCATLDLTLHWPQRWPSPGALLGFGTAALCPPPLPPAAFCAVCGADINPSRLHPPSLGLTRVKRTMPQQPPLAPSLLQLRFGFGARPTPGWRECPRCAGHASLAFPMPRYSAITAPCPGSLRHVPAACPVSLPHVPAACPMSPQHAWCPCIPARGWHGCLRSGPWFGSSAPPGLPKVAMVNVLMGHSDFMSALSCGSALVASTALSPLVSLGTVGKPGTHAGRAWG